MEKTMLIMIVVVALVAIGGLLYMGLGDAPDTVPVFVQQPSAQSMYEKPSVSTEPGQITFSLAKQSDSAGGQVRFSMK